MQQAEAISLISSAITGTQAQSWADLGCGNGTFTMALKSLIPPGSTVTAVDKADQKLTVNFIKADIEKDELGLSGLDGIMMANALHYIRDKHKLIKKLEAYFSACPTFLIVEYDTTRSKPWIPYPVSFEYLQKLFATLGYSTVNKLATRPSKFGGTLYAALINK